MAFKFKDMQLQNPRLRKRLKQLPLTFSRASVAYDSWGNSVPANTGRFNHLIGGVVHQGLLIEEAHTNSCTANQSTLGDALGNTTGLIASSGASGSISTEYALQGTKSYKIVTSGAGIAEGGGITSTPASANNPWNGSIFAKGEGVVQIYVQEFNSVGGWIKNNTGSIVTLNSEWQRLDKGITTSATTAYLSIQVLTATQQATTYYLDMGQATNTLYTLSWTLGGTTQAAETLTAPSNVLGLSEGTIELEFLANSVIKTNSLNNYLISTADGSANNQISILDDSSNNLTVTTKASVAATAVSYADSNLTLNSMVDVAVPFNSTNLKLFKDGTSVGTPLTSANLPATQQTVYLGSRYDGTLQANTIFKNVTFSKPIRQDTDITNRNNRNISGSGFMVDKEITLIAPLKTSLRAWKVKT